VRAIVIGVDGAIGAALKAALMRRGDEVIGTTRRPAALSASLMPLDLASPDLASVSFPPADIAYFCAAMTGLSACRNTPELAHRVNATGPAILARRLSEAGTRVVLLSTNAVFDWQSPRVAATCAPRPLTIYGQHKVEAERAFAGLGEMAVILRLSKVLTPRIALFRGWIDALAGGKPVTAFSDLHLAPIALRDAVEALLAFADRSVSGLFQVSGAEDISYVEAARHLACRLDVPLGRVVASRGSDAGIPPEEITTFSSLDSERYSQLTGWAPPDPYGVLDSVFGPAMDAARSRSTLAG
jgi:dTDP-4-dehydrorhamnose reductase